MLQTAESEEEKITAAYKQDSLQITDKNKK